MIEIKKLAVAYWIKRHSFSAFALMVKKKPVISNRAACFVLMVMYP
jgi:hypothetical protein